jgi:Domain of unknown function (DUF4386)
MGESNEPNRPSKHRPRNNITISGAYRRFRHPDHGVCGDILVAWALYVLLAPTNRSAALLAAWFRLMYTAIFIVAFLKLATVFRLLNTPDNMMVLWARVFWGSYWSIGLPGLPVRLHPQDLGPLVGHRGRGRGQQCPSLKPLSISQRRSWIHHDHIFWRVDLHAVASGWGVADQRTNGVIVMGEASSFIPIDIPYPANR